MCNFPSDPLQDNRFLAPHADLARKPENNPTGKLEGGRRKKVPGAIWSLKANVGGTGERTWRVFCNYLCETEPNTSCSGLPRAKLQDEGRRTTPDPSEVVRQIVEELRRGHGGSISLCCSCQVVATHLELPYPAQQEGIYQSLAAAMLLSCLAGAGEHRDRSEPLLPDVAPASARGSCSPVFPLRFRAGLCTRQ